MLQFLPKRRLGHKTRTKSIGRGAGHELSGCSPVLWRLRRAVTAQGVTPNHVPSFVREYKGNVEKPTPVPLQMSLARKTNVVPLRSCCRSSSRLSGFMWRRKWASLVSFELAGNLLGEVLPIQEHITEQPFAVTCTKLQSAQKQSSGRSSSHFSAGCPREWKALPRRVRPDRRSASTTALSRLGRQTETLRGDRWQVDAGRGYRQMLRLRPDL